MLNNKPFRILSIDGGGLRGIVALAILEWIEKDILKKKIAESFDLFAGTSTGGLIACGITVAEGGPAPVTKYNVSDLKDAYLKNADKIFPHGSKLDIQIKKLSSYLGSKHSEHGLVDTLKELFGDKRLADCIRPVLIPSYDMERLSPVYFTNRRMRELAKINGSPTANALIVDICRATSAAPTYLPSHLFSHVDDAGNKYQANCIDGGIYLNNPALAAYSEIISNAKNPIYTNDPAENRQIQEQDIYILSIGTGRTNKNIIPRRANSWGKLRWAQPIIKIMMESNSDAVHYQLKGIVKERYLRLEIDIEDKYSDMDDSRQGTLDYLLEEVNTQVIKNAAWTHQLNAFKNIAQL